MPFHGAAGKALVAGAANFALNPNALSFVASRLLVEADVWAHFRVRSFEFRLHHGATTGDMAAGFVGGVQDTIPATVTQICELLPAVYYGVTYTKPSDWVRVSKKELAGPLPWYKTVPGSADPTEELPGYICLAGASTDTLIFECRGVLEFKTAVSSSNTPAMVKLREEMRKERVREEQIAARKGLLRVLSSAAPTAAQP